jgi:hypothetical protein
VQERHPILNSVLLFRSEQRPERILRTSFDEFIVFILNFSVVSLFGVHETRVATEIKKRILISRQSQKLRRSSLKEDLLIFRHLGVFGLEQTIVFV